MRSRARIPLLVVLGAVALGAGALARWWSVRWLHPILGEQTMALTGRQVAPALLVIALVAVAGLAAVAAANGVLRRLIGLLIAVAGAGAALVTVQAAISVPADRIVDAHPQVQRILGGVHSWVGPGVSTLGALAVLAGGLLVLFGQFAGRGMGSRFDRGVPRTPHPAAPGNRSTPNSDAASIDGPNRDSQNSDGRNSDDQNSDDNARLLWKALDAGEDPTAGAAQQR